ncbi:unnamed protein product [Rhizoctonia solani]|uniref:Ubiquitin-like protease family profile domain-containing protein n=1 Tax=Rhizoctonia solani TaxID=456999 RepID=A0A8H2X3J8_9AGAM|nr:unnamed protein product [Rhizoctonia solani]
MRSPKSFAEHWMFGWINFENETLSIYDSFRTNSSANGWGFNILKSTVNHLLEHQGHQKLDFQNWSYVVEIPELGDQQTNGWACGYFTMASMEAFVHGMPPRCVTEDSVEWIRVAYCDYYRGLPLRQLVTRAECLAQKGNMSASRDGYSNPPKRVALGSDSDSTVNITSTSESEDDMSLPLALPLGTTMRSVNPDDPGESPEAFDAPNKDCAPTESIQSAKRQRQRSRSPSESSESSLSDTTSIKHNIRNSKRVRRSEVRSRTPRLSATQRHQKLLGDPNVVKVDGKIKGSAYEIYCMCDATKPRKLGKPGQPGQEWLLSNWSSHQKTCSAIHGEKKKRSNSKLAGKREPAVKSIASTATSIKSFFHPIAKASSSQPEPKAQPPDPEPEIITGRAPVNHRITTFFRPASRLELQSIRFTKRMEDISAQASEDNKPPPKRPCVGLSEPDHALYASQQLYAHRQGGVSANQWVYEACMLFPYKKWPQLPEGGRKVKMLLSGASPINPTHGVHQVPSTPVVTNDTSERKQWTKFEIQQLQNALDSCGKWAIDPDSRVVRSICCEGQTIDLSAICEHCQVVAQQAGLQRAVRENPQVLKLVGALTQGPSAAFLVLYQQARNGQLDAEPIFVEISKQFADRTNRKHNGPNAMRGIRYSPEFMNFCVIMRSFGGRTGVQYGILKDITGGASHRTLRRHLQLTGAGLALPILDEGNFIRLVKYTKMVGYDGPWIACGDGTKVTPMLNVSTAFSEEGAHILGSTLSLSETHFDSPEEQSRVMKRIEDSDALANQVWVQGMMIPLSGMPMFAVSMQPSKGGFKATDYHSFHLRLRELAEKAGIKVLATGSDGAKSEFNAHKLLRLQTSDSRLVYSNNSFGIHISCPVWDTTGPFITVSDPPHARKGVKTNMESGTHLIILGDAYVCHGVLMDLLKLPGCPLFVKDVYNSDKQDDGAACRMLHAALLDILVTDEGKLVDEKFKGFFIVNLLFGSAIDAWLKRDMSHIDRVVCLARMWSALVIFRHHLSKANMDYPELFNIRRSFFSPESTEIWCALFHQMVLLLCAHATHYPGLAFFPWHYGTPWMEHFFGLCRSFVPDFSVGQILDIYKHAEMRQQLLATGHYSSKREKDSNNGYSFDPWINNLSESEMKLLKTIPSTAEIHAAIALGWKEAVAITKCCNIEAPALPLKPSDLPDFLATEYSSSRAKERTPENSSDSVTTNSNPISSASDSESGPEPEPAAEMHELRSSTMHGSKTQKSPAQMAWVVFDRESQNLTAEAAFRAAQSSAIQEEIQACDRLLHKAENKALSSDEQLSKAQGRMAIASLLNQSTAPNSSSANLNTLVSQVLPPDYPETPFSWRLAAQYRKATLAATNVNSERIRDLQPKVGYASGHFNRNAAAHQLTNELNESEALRSETVAQKNRYRRWVLKGEPAKTTLGCELAKHVHDIQVENISSTGISPITPLERGSIVIMSTKSQWYLGEVLGIYSAGSAGRHDSFTDATTTRGLTNLSLKVYFQAGSLNLFQHLIDNIPLFTHSVAADLVYVLHGVKLKVNGDGTTYSLPGGDHGWPKWQKITSNKAQRVVQGMERNS